MESFVCARCDLIGESSVLQGQIGVQAFSALNVIQPRKRHKAASHRDLTGKRRTGSRKKKREGGKKSDISRKRFFLEMLLCVCEIELDDECVKLGSFSPFPSHLKYSVRWRSVMSAFKCVCSAVRVKY